MIQLKKKKHKFLIKSDENQRILCNNLGLSAMEQFKIIRANLGFVLPENEKCPIIGITSPTQGEGKSTVSINLSYVLAEQGSKVLLIDGDLRMPSVASKLNINRSPGLTDLLRGKGAQISEYKSNLLNTWYILPSGECPPNPSELLASSRMENVINVLKDFFDYIIIDLPPVNIVSDATSVSKLISGMIIIIQEDYTEKKELDQCYRQLKFSNVNILGCILNKAKENSNSHYKEYFKHEYQRHDND